MKINYNAIGIIIGIIILISTPHVTAQSESSEIPSWIKGVASFWVQGEINDSEFIEALAFLIDNEVIEIPGYGKIINIEKPIELQVMTLTVTTDQETYQTNEQIIISGTVQNNNLGTVTIMIINPNGNIMTMAQVSSTSSGTVTIMIINPNGNIMTMAQVSSTSSGTYTKTILTENSSGLSSGVYTIQVKYNSEKITTTFVYSP